MEKVPLSRLGAAVYPLEKAGCLFMSPRAASAAQAVIERLQELNCRTVKAEKRREETVEEEEDKLVKSPRGQRGEKEAKIAKGVSKPQPSGSASSSSQYQALLTSNISPDKRVRQDRRRLRLFLRLFVCLCVGFYWVFAFFSLFQGSSFFRLQVLLSTAM